MRAFTKRESRSIEEPLVNLTPLIDVVFVLLIAFIVVAPLLEKEEVQLAAAGGSEKSAIQQASPVSIKVFKNDKISLNGAVLSYEGLYSKLVELKNLHPTATPQLLHDKEAKFGTYQKVKNITQQAGYSSLELVLDPNE
jgi:biopolymer transport protein ExbD